MNPNENSSIVKSEIGKPEKSTDVMRRMSYCLLHCPTLAGPVGPARRFLQMLARLVFRFYFILIPKFRKVETSIFSSTSLSDPCGASGPRKTVSSNASASCYTALFHFQTKINTKKSCGAPMPDPSGSGLL